MIYDRIKELRENSGLEIREVAQKLSIHKTTYGRYERGENEIPLNVAILLAHFYEVRIDYIAGLTNIKKL